MHKYLSFPLLFMTYLFACKNGNSGPAGTNSTKLVLESTSLHRTGGDCGSTDPKSKCAEISLKYPVVKSGPSSLQQNVSTWANGFLAGMLDPAMELDEDASLAPAIDGFIEMYKEVATEMPGLPSRYAIEVTDTVLLQNAQHLTLRMDANSYTGGAHPNPLAAIATFDAVTGKRLRPVDFVKDLEKLHAAAEQKFRETQKEVLGKGFDFADDRPFVIAENVGLTTEGLFFCYLPYEVAPYATGFIEFVIPYVELEKL